MICLIWDFIKATECIQKYLTRNRLPVKNTYSFVFKKISEAELEAKKKKVY